MHLTRKIDCQSKTPNSQCGDRRPSPTSTHTAQEKQAADDGTLDVVSGFMVIDEDSRTIVLEGTAGTHGGLTAILRRVGRAGPNGQAYRALENPEVRFSRRLYTCFDADLKKVQG